MGLSFVKKDFSISVVGLGYVGLPLALEFGKQFKTIGFDLSKAKIKSYKKCFDPTGEISHSDFYLSKHLTFTCDEKKILDADFVIVAVPTPVDKANIPNLSPLISASTLVGKNLKKNAVVVFESTVYPGATEEVCIPILERESKMIWKRDFFVGYSPERINPGDKVHTLTNITKVVSGDLKKTLKKISALYKSIISAGVFEASSIKVAEAAKVIENTQRDLNIALMNELAVIFEKIGIDTSEVLKTAETKWNFLKFKPGLVGGHCIGVDPYYLTYKAQMSGYHPEVILAGRRINDGMSKFIAEKTIKLMINAGFEIRGSKVMVLGLTFKENCSDIRNSKVPQIIYELESYGVETFVHDPLANKKDCLDEYDVTLTDLVNIPQNLDAIILAVPHHEYLNISTCKKIFKSLKNPNGVLVDVKAAISAEVDLPINFWRL